MGGDAAPACADSSFRRVLVATCIGFAAVVMFGRAGEPVRPYLIAKKEGVSFSSQVAAWVVERMLDLLMILIIFGVALTRVAHSTIRSTPRIEAILKAGGAAAGVTGLVCLALLFALRQFRGEVQRRLLDGLAFLPKALLARAETFLAAFGEGMQSTRSASFTLLLVLYTVLEWALIAGCFFCVFRAFPGDGAVWDSPIRDRARVRGVRQRGADSRRGGRDADRNRTGAYGVLWNRA